MFRIIRTAAALAVLAACAGPAAAQGWSFGYSIGDPYADPYYRPVYPAYPPPPVYRRAPPVMVAPAPGRSLRSVVVLSPEEVAADLRANGFRDLSPIDLRGRLYRLTATDPGGNFVALSISVRTGRIEDVTVLEARREPEWVPAPPVRRAAPARPAPKVATAPKPKPRGAGAPPAAAAKPEPAAPAPQPAPAPAGEPDPLVVY